MKLTLQSEASECGLACLSMIASYFGNDVDLSILRGRFLVSLKGTTLSQLMRNAAAMHMTSRPLRVELADLSRIKAPCILHWNLNHFVVLKRVSRDVRGREILTILDPAVGERRISIGEASSLFTGVALELMPMPSFEAKDERKKLSLRNLTGNIVGLRKAIFQIVVVAIVLEIFALTSPLFNQFIIDEVIISGDSQLLGVIAVGFALVIVTQTGISVARSWLLVRWSTEVNYQWASRVFYHLINLPLAFFEKRHLGDIVSRFGSINTIQNTLTNLVVETLLDGLMAIIALSMMLLYSVKLTVIVIFAVLLYAILRLVTFKPFLDASQERMILSAKENSHFMESMRGVSTIKLFGKEEERHARWLNLKTDVQNRDVRTQKMTIIYKATNGILFAFQSLAVLYFGAAHVIQNIISVGMLLAFISYSSSFINRVFSLIDALVNVNVLMLHCQRLADIVLTEPEPKNYTESDLERLEPSIELRRVKFRHADGEPFVLEDISLLLIPGESTVLVGPSGCGKTTLCKIILGLLEPTEGEVLYGGVPVKRLGYNVYRSLVGTVMQDDVLLAGSIADNICFFSTEVDMTRVRLCAQRAAIHDEIIAMPMGYQTLVGDMGTSLSGGQKQRVLLARAMYKQPSVLVLDEATSHLDFNNEKKVNESLGELRLTKVMVAHRTETINTADRIVHLFNGRIIEKAI